MMADIIAKISKIEKLYHADGCSLKQLGEAQKALNIVFPEEFFDYVREFGAISFYGTEWTGLNVSGYLNVVDATKQERELNPSFPKDCFVLENQAIDGLITVADAHGHVYTVQYDKKKFLCDSLSDYLDICINRNKK